MNTYSNPSSDIMCDFLNSLAMMRIMRSSVFPLIKFSTRVNSSELNDISDKVEFRRTGVLFVI